MPSLGRSFFNEPAHTNLIVPRRQNFADPIPRAQGLQLKEIGVDVTGVPPFMDTARPIPPPPVDSGSSSDSSSGLIAGIGTGFKVLGAIGKFTSLMAAAETEEQIGRFNMQLTSIEADRDVKNTVRGTRKLISKQRAGASATGFQVSSQSFMDATRESISVAQRQIQERRQDEFNTREAIRFQSESRAAARRSQAVAGLFSSIGNILG